MLTYMLTKYFYSKVHKNLNRKRCSNLNLKSKTNITGFWKTVKLFLNDKVMAHPTENNLHTCIYTIV